MTNSDSILLDIDQHIATITLNIPQKHNALSSADIDLLCARLASVEADTQIRVLILTGAGEKTFCAGAALDQLGSGAMDGDRFADMTDQLASLRIPTICAMNGSAYGGGSEIGLACDFRLGVYGMRLFVPPARIGLCYPVRGIERFVQTLGPALTKRLLIASEEFHDQQLLDLGYLTQLLSPEELPAASQALAARIADYAPLAVQTMKAISNRIAQSSYNPAEQQDKTSLQAMAEYCNASADLREGLQANREKRPPVFQGK